MDCIICRYGELALKGKNRHIFESRLVNNLKDCLSQNNIKFELEKVRGRILIFTKDVKALDVLPKVFGLTSISGAVTVESDPETIRQAALDYVDALQDKDVFKTFRISTNRPNKDFTKTSNEMDIILGDAVGDLLKIPAKMKGADLDLGVEIQDRTFIFHEKISCFGGLPVGVSGKVTAFIENGNSLAAACLMLKRGCTIIPVALAGSDVDVSPLKAFSHGSSIFLSYIDALCDIDTFTEENGSQAIITGDTFDSLEPERYKDANTMLLHPLISYDDVSISSILSSLR